MKLDLSCLIFLELSAYMVRHLSGIQWLRESEQHLQKQWKRYVKINSKVVQLNDTRMEELVLYWIQYKNSLKSKVGCFWRFSYVYKINEVRLILLSYRCLKNVIHQIDGKNEWLLFSVTFRAKLELIFVLIFENAFC